MENSLYLALSKQMAMRTNMDIVANNIANMNTPGFRGQNVVFEEYLSDPRGNEDALSFVYDYGQYDVTKPGSVSQTGNSLDVALNGPGFFGVNGPDGEAFTRAGNFAMKADGTLITNAGFTVQGNGGGEITIPDGSEYITISEDGRMSNQDGEIGQIKIAEFENLQTLEAIGNNLYKTDAAQQEPANTKAKQGHLEGSNVNSVTEMTRMIEISRGYTSIQKLMEKENERLRSAIQKLTAK
jgi:flagellar basal-body rod protein FlgF